jgi:hypothetical protein
MLKGVERVERVERAERAKTPWPSVYPLCSLGNLLKTYTEKTEKAQRHPETLIMHKAALVRQPYFQLFKRFIVVKL